MSDRVEEAIQILREVRRRSNSIGGKLFAASYLRSFVPHVHASHLKVEMKIEMIATPIEILRMLIELAMTGKSRLQIAVAANHEIIRLVVASKMTKSLAAVVCSDKTKEVVIMQVTRKIS